MRHYRGLIMSHCAPLHATYEPHRCFIDHIPLQPLGPGLRRGDGERGRASLQIPEKAYASAAATASRRACSATPDSGAPPPAITCSSRVRAAWEMPGWRKVAPEPTR